MYNFVFIVQYYTVNIKIQYNMNYSFLPKYNTFFLDESSKKLFKPCSNNCFLLNIVFDTDKLEPQRPQSRVSIKPIGDCVCLSQQLTDYS